LRDLAEQRELRDRLFLGRLEQRPARALDPAALRGVGALVDVPFVAPDLVDGALPKPDDVEGIEADLGVGDVGADRFLIAAGHVDRDRPDRAPAVAELIEEGLQRLGVAARRAPHDGASLVIYDRCEVALAAAIGDLVDADRDEAVEAALVELVGDHALDNPPDGVLRDPQKPGDRGLGHLLRQPRDDVLEVARGRRPRARPWHRFKPHAAGPAAQPPQLGLDDATARAKVQMPPALDAAVVDLKPPAGLPAARAHPSPPPQPDRDNDPLGAEADVADRRSRQPEQVVKCRRDAHVALLASR